MASLPGNPYDGHTLGGALRQVAKLTGVHPREVHVDRGYRSHGVEDTKVCIAGARRGIAAAVRKRRQRRNVVGANHIGPHESRWAFRALPIKRHRRRRELL